MRLLKVLSVSCMLVFQILSSPRACAESLNNIDNLTIIVSSCDKYADLWDGFFTLLFKNWPSLKAKYQNTPILLIANSKSYSDSRVKTILIPKEQGWSDNMLEALKHVKTEYVLILLEDYFIERFDENRFNQLFDYMRKHKDVSYIELFSGQYTLPSNKKVQGISGALYKGRYESFRASLQAGLWRTDDFKWLLRPGESAWDFEIHGSVRSEGMRGSFINIRENPPLDYLNMTQGGYLNAENLKKAEALGAHLKNSSLPIDANHKMLLWYRKTLQGFVYHQVIVPCKNFFHWIFNKL